jgi:hypothetical protein
VRYRDDIAAVQQGLHVDEHMGATLRRHAEQRATEERALVTSLASKPAGFAAHSPSKPKPFALVPHSLLDADAALGSRSTAPGKRTRQ